MNKLAPIVPLLFILSFAFSSCQQQVIKEKDFTSSLKNIANLNDFYLTPSIFENTSLDKLPDSMIHIGTYPHGTWVPNTNKEYPATQLKKEQKKMVHYSLLYHLLGLTGHKFTAKYLLKDN